MSSATELTLKIEGMHCAACAAAVEKGVTRLDGVAECRVNFAMRSATITHDPRQTPADAILKKIDELGFSASPGQPDILTSDQRELGAAKMRFQVALVLALPLLALTLWPSLPGANSLPTTWDGIARALLAAALLAIPGRGILADAWNQLRHIRANMNSLIAMGTLTAFVWSLYQLAGAVRDGAPVPLHFDSVGMIIALVLLGRWMEAKTRGRAGDAIQSLLRLRPKVAHAVVDGAQIEVDATAVVPGMTLLVKPGERLPADGIVTEGEPIIDESMLTGEATPAEKSIGANVVGGSINGSVAFKMEATADSESSFLAQMVRMVSEAQGAKAPVQRLADRVAGIFVPTVIGLALITLGLWRWLDPGNPQAIQSVISVLIIACPCALGLATPTAVLAGTGRAAREGIIVRGGDVLERLTHLNAAIFDKTGTLTHGKLEVVEVQAFSGVEPGQLIRIVGAAESQAEHPLADAIARYARAQGAGPASVTRLEARPGFGVKADYRGQTLLIGNQSLLETEAVNAEPVLEAARSEMNRGRTTVFVALGSEVIGLVSLTDRLRSDAHEVVRQLTADLERVAMLSGDTYRTAAGVARSLELEHFEAEVKPDQKGLVVDSYRKAGYRVAMIGDGINDAPALATADVGIAIGSGADIAIEAADCVLVRSELTNVLKLFRIARQSIRIIKQNLFWAFFYNVLAIPLAAGMFYPLFGWTMSPIIAAAAMACSSVFVVSNSLRLRQLDVS